MGLKARMCFLFKRKVLLSGTNTFRCVGIAVCLSLPEFRKKLRVIGLWGEYGRKAET